MHIRRCTFSRKKKSRFTPKKGPLRRPPGIPSARIWSMSKGSRTRRRCLRVSRKNPEPDAGYLGADRRGKKIEVADAPRCQKTSPTHLPPFLTQGPFFYSYANKIVKYERRARDPPKKKPPPLLQSAIASLAPRLPALPCPLTASRCSLPSALRPLTADRWPLTAAFSPLIRPLCFIHLGHAQ